MPKMRIRGLSLLVRYGTYPIGYVTYPARHEHETPGRGAGTSDLARGGGRTARVWLFEDDHGQGRRPGRDEQERHLPPVAAPGGSGHRGGPPPVRRRDA